MTAILAAGAGPGLFHENIEAVFRFVPCDGLVDANSVTQIARFGNRYAILFASGEVLEADDVKRFEAPTIKYIALNDDIMCGIDSSGSFRVLRGSTDAFIGEKVSSLAISSTYVAIICADGSCKYALVGGGNEERIIGDAIAVGCTKDAVFVSNKQGLFKKGDDIVKIDVPRTVIIVACSEADAYVIDDSGAVFKVVEDSVIRIFGLPPVASMSVGVEHVAAVAVNGDLYTWGFNSSGQLGHGGGRPTREPKAAASRVEWVVCGAHNTWVRAGDRGPKCHPLMSTSVGKPYVVSLWHNDRLGISSAE